MLLSCWQSNYWFYRLWQLYNRTDYVRRHRPILSLLLGVLAFEVGLPLALSSKASTHSSVAATPRNVAPTHFQIVRSVLWSHGCVLFLWNVSECGVIKTIFLSFFLKKNNFTLSIQASDLGFQWLVFVVGQNPTAERAVWEDALSSCTIHFFFWQLLSGLSWRISCVLNIPKYERRMLDGLFRGVNVWL